MKQADRQIDWSHHNTDEILARIHAADGIPGVLDQLGETRVFLHNACAERELKGRPGDIIATASNGAICRATIDGAVWIGHVKPKLDAGGGIKLPATHVVGHVLPVGLPHIETTAEFFDDHPVKEIQCEIIGKIGYLHFRFHNGAMSTSQCRLLLEAYKDLARRSLKIIVLMGGDDNWSNGIHLNHIEANEDPAEESWRNINAMEDLVYEVITTTDKLVIAALSCNAGAGGVILPLAADGLSFVFEIKVMGPARQEENRVIFSTC